MAGPVTPVPESALEAERQVVAWLARVKVLPVLTVFDVRTVSATCRALADGGISCVEITYRTAWADEAIARGARFPG
jgi:2-keto-3-deoxy-6-phosphogluconate aldolase